MTDWASGDSENVKTFELGDCYLQPVPAIEILGWWVEASFVSSRSFIRRSKFDISQLPLLTDNFFTNAENNYSWFETVAGKEELGMSKISLERFSTIVHFSLLR